MTWLFVPDPTNPPRNGEGDRRSRWRGPDEPQPYNILSFCAGVGGLELGIRIARPDARGILYVEREAAAAASLVASMEAGWFHPAPVWSDAGSFDARPWRGLVHCLASGDPCQPNSVAGKRQGDAADRWLIDQLLRIVEECQPDRLFRENVPGNLDGQLAALVPPLERLGYRVAGGLFSAAEAGASHRRERFFLMADRIGARWGCEAGAYQTGQPGLGEQGGARRGECGGDAVRRFEFVGGGMDHPECAERRQGSYQRDGDRQGGDPSRRVEGSDRPAASGSGLGDPALHRRREGRPEPELRSGRHPAAGDGGAMADADGPHPQGRRGRSDASRRQEPDGYARLARGEMGLPAFAPGPADPRWPAILARAPQLEPAVRRVADGMAGRIERLRACGNGVVPLCAALAWQLLDRTLAAAPAQPAGRPADRAGTGPAEAVLK